MISSTEYRQWLKQRRATARAEAKATTKRSSAPEISFRDWIVTQALRLDSTGALARDIQSEEKRIGRQLTALNARVDLVFYVRAAPKSVGLDREVALRAWREWLEFNRTKEASELDHQI